MLRDVTTTVTDGLLGLQTDKGTGVHIKIGISPIVSATPITITGNMDAARIKTLLGYSPLADAVMDSVENGSNKILCIPVAASTAGTTGTVTKTATGGGNATATGTPYNAFGIVVKFTTPGGFNTAAFVYSIDGGGSFSDDITLGLTGIFAVPNTGVTLTFTQGTEAEASFKAGDTYSLTTTAPKMTNGDVLTAIGKLQSISDAYEYVHIVGTSQKELWAAVATSQQELANTYHKPLFFVLEAYEKSAEETLEQYTAGLETAKKSINNMDIQVVTARSLYVKMDGVTQDINNAGIVCGLYAKAAVQRSIGRTSEFALSAEKMLALRPSGIEAYLERLDAAQYLTFRQYDGLSGFYVTNARVMSPTGSDYRYAEDIRVKNKITRETRKQALLQLQGDVDMSDQQGCLDAIAKFIEIPLDEMIKAKEITSASITVPEGQDILTTGTLHVVIRYVPIGHIRAITIDLGVTNPYKS